MCVHERFRRNGGNLWGKVLFRFLKCIFVVCTLYVRVQYMYVQYVLYCTYNNICTVKTFFFFTLPAPHTHTKLSPLANFINTRLEQLSLFIHILLPTLIIVSIPINKSRHHPISLLCCSSLTRHLAVRRRWMILGP